MAKVNYKIHTDAIKENLIPPELTPQQKSFVYANEADLLNVVLFGASASLWRKANPDKEGNMRDHATIEQLLVLANLENINAIFIEQGMPQVKRMDSLYDIAKSQLEAIARTKSIIGLKTISSNYKNETK